MLRIVLVFAVCFSVIKLLGFLANSQKAQKYLGTFGNAAFTGLKWAIVAAVISGGIAFFGAPMFFGVALITSAAVGTVTLWTGVSLLAGTIYKLWSSNRTRPETYGQTAN